MAAWGGAEEFNRGGRAFIPNFRDHTPYLNSISSRGTDRSIDQIQRMYSSAASNERDRWGILGEGFKDATLGTLERFNTVKPYQLKLKAAEEGIEGQKLQNTLSRQQTEAGGMDLEMKKAQHGFMMGSDEDRAVEALRHQGAQRAPGPWRPESPGYGDKGQLSPWRDPQAPTQTPMTPTNVPLDAPSLGISPVAHPSAQSGAMPRWQAMAQAQFNNRKAEEEFGTSRRANEQTTWQERARAADVDTRLGEANIRHTNASTGAIGTQSGNAAQDRVINQYGQALSALVKADPIGNAADITQVRQSMLAAGVPEAVVTGIQTEAMTARQQAQTSRMDITNLTFPSGRRATDAINEMRTQTQQVDQLLGAAEQYKANAGAAHGAILGNNPAAKAAIGRGRELLGPQAEDLGSSDVGLGNISTPSDKFAMFAAQKIQQLEASQRALVAEAGDSGGQQNTQLQQAIRTNAKILGTLKARLGQLSGRNNVDLNAARGGGNGSLFQQQPAPPAGGAGQVNYPQQDGAPQPQVGAPPQAANTRPQLPQLPPAMSFRHLAASRTPMQARELMTV